MKKIHTGIYSRSVPPLSLVAAKVVKVTFDRDLSRASSVTHYMIFKSAELIGCERSIGCSIFSLTYFKEVSILNNVFVHPKKINYSIFLLEKNILFSRNNLNDFKLSI